MESYPTGKNHYSETKPGSSARALCTDKVATIPKVQPEKNVVQSSKHLLSAFIKRNRQTTSQQSPTQHTCSGTPGRSQRSLATHPEAAHAAHRAGKNRCRYLSACRTALPPADRPGLQALPAKRARCATLAQTVGGQCGEGTRLNPRVAYCTMPTLQFYCTSRTDQDGAIHGSAL